MKFLIRTIFVLSASFILADSAHFAHAGGKEAHGGSVVKDKQGNWVPADLYFKNTKYQLPYAETSKLDLNQYPDALKELRLIAQMITNRMGRKGIFQIEIDRKGHAAIKLTRSQDEITDSDIEIYSTEDLLGDDTSGSGLEEQQVGFSYYFTQLFPSRAPQLRRIIEIKESLFKTLTPRNQALMMVHEICHQFQLGGHEMIASMIRDLSVVLEVRDRQQAGDRDTISNSEYQASLELQRILGYLIGFEFFETGHYSVARATYIDRRGGGYVFEHKFWQDSANQRTLPYSNFVGVDSYLELESIPYTELIYYNYDGLQNNVVLNSAVKLDRLELFSGCQDSRFEDLARNSGTYSRCEIDTTFQGADQGKIDKIQTDCRITTIVCNRSHNNLIKNVMPSIYVLHGDNNELNHLSLGHGGIFILSGNNKVIHSELDSYAKGPAMDSGVEIENVSLKDVVTRFLRSDATSSPLKIKNLHLVRYYSDHGLGENQKQLDIQIDTKFSSIFDFGQNEELFFALPRGVFDLLGEARTVQMDSPSELLFKLKAVNRI